MILELYGSTEMGNIMLLMSKNGFIRQLEHHSTTSQVRCCRCRRQCPAAAAAAAADACSPVLSCLLTMPATTSQYGTLSRKDAFITQEMKDQAMKVSLKKLPVIRTERRLLLRLLLRRLWFQLRSPSDDL